MITLGDIVEVEIPSEHLGRIIEFAENATLGGKSNVHEQRDARSSTQFDDQLVGQLGQYAGTVWLLEDPDIYFAVREQQDKNPWKGDGGSDIPGMQIDFKASVMRIDGRSPLQYVLPIRPKERHADNIYVLVLVPKDFDGLKNSKVLIIGWINDSMVPNRLHSEGVFKGAYVINATDLNKLGDY